MKNGYLTALAAIAFGGIVVGLVLASGSGVPILNVIGTALLGLGVTALIAFLSISALLRGLGRNDAPTRLPRRQDRPTE